MIKTLGIDIGIASIGWAVIEGEYTEKGLENKEIVDSGVRIFTKAENQRQKNPLHFLEGLQEVQGVEMHAEEPEWSKLKLIYHRL